VSWLGENSHIKTPAPDDKAAAFTFPGKKLQVAIFWQQEQIALGRMVHPISIAE
jgi:hypothetical protein